MIDGEDVTRGREIYASLTQIFCGYLPQRLCEARSAVAIQPF
jgi:hypothetical protein